MHRCEARPNILTPPDCLLWSSVDDLLASPETLYFLKHICLFLPIEFLIHLRGWSRVKLSEKPSKISWNRYLLFCFCTFMIIQINVTALVTVFFHSVAIFQLLLMFTGLWVPRRWETYFSHISICSTF